VGGPGAGKLGDGDAAHQLFAMLNPINHALTPQDAEPLQGRTLCRRADVYSTPRTKARRLDLVHRLCRLDVRAPGSSQIMEKSFEEATGIDVAMTRKSSGETFAQIQAEASNPKGRRLVGGHG
jgi:hypothetical protein